MEMQMESGTRIGNGVYISGDLTFDAKTMEPLVASLSEGLKELLPIEDRPAYYMLWISAQLRDFLRTEDVLIPQTVYQLTSNFHRSASFFCETLVIHKRRPSQKLAVFTVIPGALGTAERAILQQVASLREDLTPDYSNVLLAVFSQSVTEDQCPSSEFRTARMERNTILGYWGSPGVKRYEDKGPKRVRSGV